MSCIMEIKELGLKCELIEVSWKRNKNVTELNQLNPLETTPVLVGDDGKVLAQNIAILEYFADQYSKGAHLAPAGTWERAQTLQWLSFVASDFHKAFGPIFRSEAMTQSEAAQQEIEQFAKKNVIEYLHYIENALKEDGYICGPQFTIADCYLYTVLGWCEPVEVSLVEFKKINAYMQRMSQRPGIKQALELE
ncbi:unnamed protein product [Sphagnum tenellum]